MIIWVCAGPFVFRRTLSTAICLRYDLTIRNYGYTVKPAAGIRVPVK